MIDRDFLRKCLRCNADSMASLGYSQTRMLDNGINAVVMFACTKCQLVMSELAKVNPSNVSPQPTIEEIEAVWDEFHITPTGLDMSNECRLAAVIIRLRHSKETT